MTERGSFRLGEEEYSYEKVAEKLEHDFLFESSLPAREAEGRLQALRILKRTGGGLPDYFEGVSRHEASNQYYGGFLAYLGREAREMGKQVDSLELEEVQEIFARFPDGTLLKTAEEQAISFYEKAAKEWWTARYVNAIDARLQMVDLLARGAARIKDPLARGAKQADDERQLRAFIPEIENPGKRAEYQLIWLIRRWARERGGDHLVVMEHGLPREDMNLGIDARFMLGEGILNLNIKTLSKDEYRREYNEHIVALAKNKALHTTSVVVVVDATDLRDLFRLEGEEVLSKEGNAKLTKTKQKFLSSLAEQFPSEQVRESFRWLLGVKKTKTKEPGIRITEKNMKHYMDVATLVKFGVISQKGLGDFQQILTAKEKLVEAMLKLGNILTMDDLKHPSEEIIEKVQRTMREI